MKLLEDNHVGMSVSVAQHNEIIQVCATNKGIAMLLRVKTSGKYIAVIKRHKIKWEVFNTEGPALGWYESDKDVKLECSLGTVQD